MDDHSSRRLLIAIAMVLVPQVVCAEIFRCVAKNGLPLYQNFPCEFDSIGAMTTLVRTTQPQLPRATAGPVVPYVRSVSQPEPGMSPVQVRQLLGEPLEIVAEQVGDQPPTEVWRYLDKSVRFVADHVAAVETWN